jgi:nicotinate phosphoribosyltransferase
MMHENELEAFESYALAFPKSCSLLVDTYDTLDGVKNAIQVGKKLRALGLSGADLHGIRIDSGDLAKLSKQARTLLDAEDFKNTKIVVSNDLDEHIIVDLLNQGAPIDIFGVGTKLATAYDQPALGGVYKVTAVKNAPNENWVYKIKLSETEEKITTPGRHQIRRFYDATTKQFLGDVMYEVDSPPNPNAYCKMISLKNTRVVELIPEGTPFTDLLVPVFEAGVLVYDIPTATESRTRAKEQLASLSPKMKALKNPAKYPTGVSLDVFELRQNMIEVHKKDKDSSSKNVL